MSTQGVKYNEQDFDIEISIKYAEKGIIAGSSEKLNFPIDRDNLLEILISKDIQRHLFSGLLVIKDLGNLIGYNIMPNGNWKVYISIFQKFGVDLGKTDKESTTSYEFLINKIEPFSPDQKTTNFKIFLIDPEICTFSKSVPFSSQDNLDRTEIFRKLLIIAGYDQLQVPTISKCGKTDNFITDNNSSLMVHANYLCNKIYDKSNGFLFFYWDMFDKKFVFNWSKKVLTGSAVEESSYNFIKYSSATTLFKGDDVVNGFIIYDHFKLSDTLRFFVDSFIQDFNLKENKNEILDARSITFDKMKTLFDENNNNYPTVMPYENPLSGGMLSPLRDKEGNYYNISTEDEFIAKLKLEYFKNNLICVRIPGIVWRKIGEKYHIEYDEVVSETKLKGDWFCAKIVDEFKNGEYNQYIFLVRGSTTFDIDKVLQTLNGESMANTVASAAKKLISVGTKILGQ